MRNAGQQQRALFILALDVSGHLIEGAGQGTDFRGAGFGDAGRRRAASQQFCGAGQFSQRPIDAGDHQEGADHGQRQHQRAPADPAQRFIAFDAPARQ